MTTRLSIIFVLLTFFSFGQTPTTDSLLKLSDEYEDQEKYDSVIYICKQIQFANRKLAKEKNLDCTIARSYYHLKQYDNCIVYSKKFLKVPATKYNSKGWIRLIWKRTICSYLFEIYFEREEYNTALTYLKKMESKYDYFLDGKGRSIKTLDLYKKFIACYDKLGDTQRRDLYETKFARASF
jgi:tetratricopeptide (TPR) repeat protein